MKLSLSVLLVLFFIAPAEAIENKLIYVFAEITKDSPSDTIEIEYEQKSYTGKYREENQTFDNIDIPFKVKSPISVNQQYHLTLSQSDHQCDMAPLDVVTELDGHSIQKGDRLDNLDFVDYDSNFRWTRHILRLSFPEIKQTPQGKDCSGNLSLIVGLHI
ncbi:hypothetical protein ACT0HV_000574 [Vibrio diabolicus]